MKHFILLMVVLMITSTTLFSQSIGKAKLGLSLDETIKQCQSVGYELVERGEDYAKFLVPNNDSPYDFNVTLNVSASPKSKIVWFGLLLFSGGTRKEVKETFFSTSSLLEQKFGKPNKKKRHTRRWYAKNTWVYLEKTKRSIMYTVSSNDGWDKVKSEY